MLDESEVKPPFFPPFTPPKKRVRESPQGGGGPRILFFMEDAEPSVSTLYTLSRFSLPTPVAAPPFSFPPYPPSYPPSTPACPLYPPPAPPPPPPLPPPPPPPLPSSPCPSPLRLLLLARLLLLRLFNRIVLASETKFKTLKSRLDERPVVNLKPCEQCTTTTVLGSGLGKGPGCP